MAGSFAIFGLAVIVLGAVSARLNRHLYSSGQPSRRWRIAYRVRWLVGILLGIAGAFVSYPSGGATETYRIYGFPFLVAAFDTHGFDYVGPLSLLSFLANVFAAYFLTQIAVWGLGRLWQEAQSIEPDVPGPAPKVS